MEKRLKDYISQKSACPAPRDRRLARARPFGSQLRSRQLPSSFLASRPPHRRGRGGSRVGAELEQKPELEPQPQRHGNMEA